MKNILISRGGLIAFIAFLVYLPALKNGFVNWDDPRYIAEMQRFQSISISNIYKAFTGYYVSNWHPLTILSHAVDYSLWGLDSCWHHLGNNLLHACNSLLVFILTFQLLTFNDFKEEKKQKYLTVAFIAALLFAIHPIHVESVAWVSERKDLLCGFFFLLAIILYNRYCSVASKKNLLYMGSLLFFILSLISKPMAVTLPAVLLILDFYPLRRFENLRDVKQIARIIIEKIPFLFLSLLVSVLTVKAQAEFSAVGSMRVFPFEERLLNAFHSLLFYLIKMLFPFNLAPLYSYPEGISFFSLKYFFATTVIVLITLFTLIKINKNRACFVMWFYYVVTLLPVLGIIQVGGQAAADRYTYLPGIPFFILAGLAVTSIADQQTKIYNVFAVIVITFVSLLMSSATVNQIGVWRNSLNLWNHEIKILPNSSPFIYNNRGNAYMDLKMFEKANADFSRAISMGPTYLLFYANRGTSFMESGQYMKAIYDFTHIIKIDKKNENAYNSRGAAYHILGRINEAQKDYERALEINPDNGKTSYNLALILEGSGNREKALFFYKKAARLGIAEATQKLR